MKDELMVFTIPPNELEDRLDVVFYSPVFRKTMKQILKHLKVAILGEISIITRILGFETEKYINYIEKGIPYLRVQNIKEFEIDLHNVKFISNEVHQQLKRSQLKPKDIVLTITGRVGTAAIVPDNLKECNASQEIVRIRVKSDINPYYLTAFLNSKLGKLLIGRWQSGSTRPRTLIKNIRNIPIPILPDNTQIKVEELTKDCLQKKKEIETKIKGLKELVNETLTNYLRIKLPAHEEKLIFIVVPTYINDRLDVDFYSPRHTRLIKVINEATFRVETLGQISKYIVSGQRPKGGVKYIGEGVPSIGGEHITSEGDFSFDDIKYIPKDFHQKQKKSWINPLDILIVKDGATTGKVAIVPEDFPFKDCNINEHVFKIEVKSDYNPYYVFSYLFSSLGQEQINRLTSGAAQKGITRDAIESVKIITPPTEIQANIADEVKRRKEERKQLKKEAEEIVEKVKKEVEKMVVGET